MTQPNDPVQACVALGSNLGDRERNIRDALALVDKLASTRVQRVSSLIETAAVQVGAADPGGSYINAAAVVQTRLSARHLLESFHRIENALGRDRTNQPHGAARTLDLDLLLYGDQIIDEADLHVPHPALAQRRFVLEPLAQVAANVSVPGLSATVAHLLAALKSPTLKILCALVALLGAHQPAVAQPVEVPAAIALAEIAQTYQRAPTAERISMTVRAKRPTAAGQPQRFETTRSDIMVRLDPGQEEGARPRAIALDLGQLRFYAGDGRITIISTANPETFWQATYQAKMDLTPKRLAEILQPVPLPQLALVRAAGDYGRVEILPWIGPVIWERLNVDPKAPDPVYRLKGRSAAGEVEMFAEPVNGQWRLRRMSAVLPAAKGAAVPEEDRPRMELVFSALTPDDPATWKIDTAARREVKSLRELNKRQDSLVGQPFPLTSLSRSDGRAVTLTDLFQGRAVDLFPNSGQSPAAKPGHIILVLRRPGESHDAASLNAANSVATAAAARFFPRCLAAGGSNTPWIVVLAEGAAAPKPSDWSLWVPAAPLARLAPHEPLMVVAISADEKIRAVVPVDVEDPPLPETLADELARILCPESAPAAPAAAE